MVSVAENALEAKPLLHNDRSLSLRHAHYTNKTDASLIDASISEVFCISLPDDGRQAMPAAVCDLLTAGEDRRNDTEKSDRAGDRNRQYCKEDRSVVFMLTHLARSFS